MTDRQDSIQDTHRTVGTGRIAAGEGPTVRLQRAYPAPDRIPENIERVHSRNIPALTYISQG